MVKKNAFTALYYSLGDVESLFSSPTWCQHNTHHARWMEGAIKSSPHVAKYVTRQVNEIHRPHYKTEQQGRTVSLISPNLQQVEDYEWSHVVPKFVGRWKQSTRYAAMKVWWIPRAHNTERNVTIRTHWSRSRKERINRRSSKTLHF